MTKKTRHLFEKKLRRDYSTTLCRNKCVKSQFKYFHRLPFLHQNQPTQAIHGWLKMKKNSAIKILWLPLLSNRQKYSGNILWNAIKTWDKPSFQIKIWKKKHSGLRLFCQNKSTSAMSRHILEFLPFYKKKDKFNRKKRIYPFSPNFNPLCKRFQFK